MPFFKSFPEESEVGDVYEFEPRIWNHFRQCSRELMRGPSPLTFGERELIAGFVSGLNACEFCHGAHTAAATAFGFPDGLMPSLLSDIESAPVDEKLKPLLRYGHCPNKYSRTKSQSKGKKRPTRRVPFSQKWTR